MTTRTKYPRRHHCRQKPESGPLSGCLLKLPAGSKLLRHSRFMDSRSPSASAARRSVLPRQSLSSLARCETSGRQVECPWASLTAIPATKTHDIGPCLQIRLFFCLFVCVDDGCFMSRYVQLSKLSWFLCKEWSEGHGPNLYQARLSLACAFQMRAALA